jgi:peptidoglycan/LPS O-acetylase OafA/YrhL
MKKLFIASAAFLFALVPIVALAQDTGEGGTTPVDALSTYALWGIAAGIIGTFVAAVINQYHWPSTLKLAIFFVWCCIAAGVDAYFKRELSLADWSRALLLVFVAGQAMYMAAKPAIKEVEIKTTVTAPSAP